MCFRRKTKAESNIQDREIIEENSKTIDVLIKLSNDEEYIEKLRYVQETLKYLTPSTDGKVYAADKKIRNIIGDLKIALNKSVDKEECKKADGLLRDLDVAIAERKVLE